MTSMIWNTQWTDIDLVSNGQMLLTPTTPHLPLPYFLEESLNANEETLSQCDCFDKEPSFGSPALDHVCCDLSSHSFSSTEFGYEDVSSDSSLWTSVDPASDVSHVIQNWCDPLMTDVAYGTERKMSLDKLTLHQDELLESGYCSSCESIFPSPNERVESYVCNSVSFPLTMKEDTLSSPYTCTKPCNTSVVHAPPKFFRTSRNNRDNKVKNRYHWSQNEVTFGCKWKINEHSMKPCKISTSNVLTCIPPTNPSYIQSNKYNKSRASPPRPKKSSLSVQLSHKKICQSFLKKTKNVFAHNPTVGRKRLHLLQFIEKLLQVQTGKDDLSEFEFDHSTTSCLEWIDEPARIFVIKNTEELAYLWGNYKNNKNMTFASLARSLRLNYELKKLEHVQGQRHHYRFLDG